MSPLAFCHFLVDNFLMYSLQWANRVQQDFWIRYGRVHNFFMKIPGISKISIRDAIASDQPKWHFLKKLIKTYHEMTTNASQTQEEALETLRKAAKIANELYPIRDFWGLDGSIFVPDHEEARLS